LLSALVLSLFAALPQDDFPAKAPAADADAHVAYQDTSAGGLRYLWWLPEGYDGESPRNLTVILHGTGLDYRWGAWNNAPGVFRPGDIVVSVDGPSAGRNSTRLFLGEPRDAEAVRDFLAELRQKFAVKDIFLYGHSQGGFFVVYYAGEFPETVAGVVAHASGAWTWTKESKGLRKVAVAYMHGTADPVVPYRQSPGSRGHFVEAGFELTHLRRLIRYNHWPNAKRANEALAWCEGMTTDSPDAALAAARDMLAPKGTDQYGFETVPSFSGGYEVLRRFTKKGYRPFKKKASPEQTAQAELWMEQVEAHAEAHVAELQQTTPKKLKLDGGPWLGHLISLREDFRGVPPVEDYVKKTGFDKTLKKHEKAVSAFFEAWYDENANVRSRFEAAVTTIGDCYLYEGLPFDLAKQMAEWKQDASSYVIPEDLLEQYADFEAWEQGWKGGLERYQVVWKRWEGVGGG